MADNYHRYTTPAPPESEASTYERLISQLARQQQPGLARVYYQLYRQLRREESGATKSPVTPFKESACLQPTPHAKTKK